MERVYALISLKARVFHDWYNNLAPSSLSFEMNSSRRSRGPPRRRQGQMQRRGLVTDREMKTLLPIKSFQPYAPTRNIQPGFNKTVRIVISYTTGVVRNVTMADIFAADAGDYGVAVTRGWSTARLHSIKVWGPSTGGALFPEVILQVFIPSPHSTSSAMTQFSASIGDQTNSTYRPFIGWRYGKVASQTGWVPSASVVFLIPAAGATGIYVVDVEATFN
jgi:hypothetical protein